MSRRPVTFATVLLIAGCSSTGIEPAAERPFVADAWTPAPAPGGEAQAEAGVVSDAQAQAQRLMQAMESGGAGAGESGGGEAAGGSGLPWSDEMLEPGPRRAVIDTPTPSVAVAPTQPLEPPAAEPDAQPPLTSPAPPPEPMSRDELVAAVARMIRNGDESDAHRATAAVGLALAANDGELDPSLLASLPPRDQDTAIMLHEAVRRLANQAQAVDEGGTLDPAAVADALRELGGDRPIRIREALLCRRVSGYGMYEPFEGHTFLAGREQPMIVYVELDDFRSLDRGDGQHEVSLQEEIVLYNATDGLAVWRQEPVEMTDLSRNRRRDFFTVRLVKLPARLSVGKYKLKVRVTDLHGGSVDETTLPVEFVADAELATARAGASR